MGVEAALTTPGLACTVRRPRVRQARREGVREKPAVERFSRADHQLEPDECGLGSSACPGLAPATRWTVNVVVREVTVKACGVAVARLQGHSWTPHPSNGPRVNVGTNPAVPSPARLLAGRNARGRPMPSGWDGGGVIVRDRESRSHGEGPQCACRVNAEDGAR